MNRARAALLAFLAAPLAALAHHSGLYDEQNVLAIEGAITNVRWVNPHVHITVVANADGGAAPISWDVEATSINALERWGVRRDWFAPGERVTVQGPAARFEKNALAAATMDFADGRHVVLWPTIATRLKLAPTGPGGLLPPSTAGAAAASAPERGLFRVWTPRGLLTRIANLPLTPAAAAAKEAYRPLEDDPALRCIPPGMPVLLDTPFPIELVDQGDRIVMRLEEWDGERTIFMQASPNDAAPSPNGVSIGHWEGRTLVVATSRIDYAYSDDRGTPQSRDAAVLERYTPSADGSRLDFEVTVTDPATYTEPLVRRGWMSFEPGEQLKPYDCTLVR